MRLARFGILLLLFFLLLSGCRVKTEAPFSLVFLDVGQGNAALLQTPQGNILIDCGPEAAQETLCRKLQARGVQELKFLIATHPDEDHIGGADVILEQFEVGCVLYNGAAEETESFLRFRETANQKGVSLVAVDCNDEATLGELQIVFYHPVDKTDPGEGNGGSLVFRAEYAGFSVLFTGDADAAVEKTLLQTPGADHLAATVLQVGHHGAETSSSAEFLQAVTPTYAVISCGAANRYGHPDGRVLERLAEVGAQVLRTDLSGDIAFLWDGNSLQMQLQMQETN